MVLKNTIKNRFLLQTAEREAFNALNGYGIETAKKEEVHDLMVKYIKAWQSGCVVIREEW